MLTTAKYLWLDLETSGLDWRREWILEAAAIVTGADLEPIGEPLVMMLNVRGDTDHLRRRLAENGLTEMHADLVADMLDEANRVFGIHEIDARLAELAERYEWTDGKPILAGSSIHFDRRFVDIDLPEFAERLHYRMLDASTLKMVAVDAGHDIPKIEGGHRALPDIRASLETARLVRGCFR